jgi:3'-5' exoribonuclease
MELIKKQFVSDLAIGGRAESIFLVADKKVRKKKNGEDYCTVLLQDKEGSIEGVLWTEVYLNTGQFDKGDFVLLKGEVKGYRGGKQIVVNSITRLDDSKKVIQSEFIKASKKNIEDMFNELKGYADGIKNNYLRKLLKLFFGDANFVKDFKNSTAAVQYHHAFKGGLLEHTLNVTKICDAVYKIYKNLNYDLLISGAILHDIGKIREYEMKLNTEVTDQGRLLGHITIGYGWILEKIKQIEGFPVDLANRLLHIILSHHGHKEFGSPKRPKILEAFIVYHVDHMDSDVGGYNLILEANRNGSDWSDYVKNFERPVFLKKLELNEDEYIEEDADDEGVFSGTGEILDNKEVDESAEKKDGEQDGLF